MIIDLREFFAGQKAPVNCNYSFNPKRYNNLYAGDKNIIEVSATVENIEGRVVLSATINCELASSCDRCLEPVTLTLTVPVLKTLIFEEDEQDDTLDDYYVTETREVDLDRLFTDEMLLYFPSKVVCKDDCSGLCSVCGNKKSSGCSCEEKHTDSRFDVLKQLLEE